MEPDLLNNEGDVEVRHSKIETLINDRELLENKVHIQHEHWSSSTRAPHTAQVDLAKTCLFKDAKMAVLVGLKKSEALRCKVNMGKTCLFEDEKMAVLVGLKKSEALCCKGDCHWAKWMLFLRVRGREHEASFFNSRSNLSKQMVHTSKLNVHEMDEIIHTVDDIAEGGGELVALATLMYESAPIEEFLCTGSVSSNCTSSSQCTLENLKPGLEKFPTLWRALLSVCFGTASIGVSTSSSSCKYWFLFDGNHFQVLYLLVLTFYIEKTIVFNGNIDGTNPITWEAAIQKSVEKELYSSIEAYTHFDMKHKFASLLESHSCQHVHRWLSIPTETAKLKNFLKPCASLLSPLRFSPPLMTNTKLATLAPMPPSSSSRSVS